MPQHSSQDETPPMVRRLNVLVTLLTVTMIIGLLVIVTLIFLTFQRSRDNRAMPPAAIAVSLPAGQTAMATTFGTGWIAVVTTDEAGQERILIMEPDGQTLRQVIKIADP